MKDRRLGKSTPKKHILSGKNKPHHSGDNIAKKKVRKINEGLRIFRS